MGFRNVAVCLALGLSFAEGFAQPSAMGGRKAASKAGSSSSCSKASAAGAGAPLKMSGGGNEGGLDKEAYYRRLKERQEEIKRGEGMQYANSPELLSLITDDPNGIEGELTPEEVERLRKAAVAKAAQDSAALMDNEEEDEEAVKAMLAMFAAQGDVDPSVVESKSAPVDPKDLDFEAMYRRDQARGLKKDEPTGGRVIELDTPLGSEDSAALLKAMGRYSEMEKEIWTDVKQEAADGTLEPPGDVKQSFKIG